MQAVPNEPGEEAEDSEEDKKKAPR
jgi:hypothetical protein